MFEIDKLTMTEKLLIVRSMIERGELVVLVGFGDHDDIYDELFALFTPDRDRIKIIA